jgi:hypothetical protein
VTNYSLNNTKIKLSLGPIDPDQIKLRLAEICNLKEGNFLQNSEVIYATAA